mmetsp:Transcript_16616/g.42935  ORF Transcript_16616/g.42935 Transcript_16616/m.42935 type:complete len:211 (-) Transcript_16616:133-765(-)
MAQQWRAGHNRQFQKGFEDAARRWAVGRRLGAHGDPPEPRAEAAQRVGRGGCAAVGEGRAAAEQPRGVLHPAAEPQQRRPPQKAEEPRDTSGGVHPSARQHLSEVGGSRAGLLRPRCLGAGAGADRGPLLRPAAQERYRRAHRRIRRSAGAGRVCGEEADGRREDQDGVLQPRREDAFARGGGEKTALYLGPGVRLRGLWDTEPWHIRRN